MKQDIEITAILSKTESVKRGTITANIRTDGQTVTSIENGAYANPETGAILATFSQWQGSGLNIQFSSTDGTELAILTEVTQFLNDVRL